MKHRKRKTVIKCCKCRSMRKSMRKPARKPARKSMRKPVRKPARKSMRKPARKSMRKSMRKKLGAAPPDYFKDYSVKDQLERVLDLVKESDLDERVKDFKTGSDVTINSTNWSKLTYFNAYKIINGGNNEDMKNIVYMLKHDVYQHKKANKEEWKKKINDAIFKDFYMDKFKDKSYNGPTIKESTKRITLKYLIIIILEHRLKVLDWFKTKQSANRTEVPNSRAENVSQKPVPNKFNLNRETTPNNWNNESLNHPNNVVSQVKESKAEEEVPNAEEEEVPNAEEEVPNAEEEEVPNSDDEEDVPNSDDEEEEVPNAEEEVPNAEE